MDFNESWNAQHFIKVEVPLYDSANSNTEKWLFKSDDSSYISIARSYLN